MKNFFANSNFKKDNYYKRESFKEMLYSSKKAGYGTTVNTIRLLNNCKYARSIKGAISLSDIFRVYWPKFQELNKNKLTRKGLVSNIEKFIKCKDFSYGYKFYECTNCNNFYIMGFTCKSRFCPSCGNKYRDQRTANASDVLIDIPHRQFVFTVPFELRIHFRIHREMLGFLFQSVNETFNYLLKSSAPLAYKFQKRKPGIISFIHTFGRDLKWHPHIHALVAERYVDKDGKLHKFSYFHFNQIRKVFMFILFNKVRNHYHENYPNQFKKICVLLKELTKKYPNGFYVYGPQSKNATLKSMKALTNYIVRYASHPAISEKRIINIDYQTNKITWFYDPHEDDDIKDEEQKQGRQIIEEDVFKFIEKLIIHVPDSYFHQIRYYGFYARKLSSSKLIDELSLFPLEEIKKMKENTMWINDLKKSYGYSPILCYCGATMTLNMDLSYFPRRGSYG